MDDEILEKLSNEYEENKKKIDDLDNKIWVTYNNLPETKLTFSFGFLSMFWLLSLFTSPVIAKFGIIPVELIHPLFMTTSILGAIICQKGLYKKRKYRQSLKEISEAEKEEDLLEENTRYELEKEKLSNKNKALEKFFDHLSNGDLEKSSFDNYNDFEKEAKKLETISTQNFLATKFMKIRDKSQILNYLSDGLVGFTLGIMLSIGTIIGVYFTNGPLEMGLFELLAPGGIGALASFVYDFNKNKKNKTVFNYLNNELGEDKLPQFIENYYADEDIELQLEKQIEKVGSIMCQEKVEENKKLNLDENSVANAKVYLANREKYDDCLRKQNDQELMMAKSCDNKTYKDLLIKKIEQILPIDYTEFKKLDANEQQKIINQVKEEQGNIQKDLCQKKIDLYFSNLEAVQQVDLNLGHDKAKTLTKNK